jgi:hypothetical protein
LQEGLLVRLIAPIFHISWYKQKPPSDEFQCDIQTVLLIISAFCKVFKFSYK